MQIRVERTYNAPQDFYSKQAWHSWLYNNIGNSIEDWYIYEHYNQFIIAIANDADALAFKLKFGL